MLGHAATHVEGPPGHHRPVRRPPDPGRRSAARYGVHRTWVYRFKARYEAEGETALEPRSRRPKPSPSALTPEVVDLVRTRKELADAGRQSPVGWWALRWASVPTRRTPPRRLPRQRAARDVEPVRAIVRRNPLTSDTHV
jgi:hypothetical protein